MLVILAHQNVIVGDVDMLRLGGPSLLQIVSGLVDRILILYRGVRLLPVPVALEYSFLQVICGVISAILVKVCPVDQKVSFAPDQVLAVTVVLQVQASLLRDWIRLHDASSDDVERRVQRMGLVQVDLLSTPVGRVASVQDVLLLLVHHLSLVLI